MGDFIRPGTVFPAFLQFPEFLLRVPVSQTAKLVYVLLYNRTRLSRKNNWVRDGKVYTVYPVAKLAEKLGKSRSCVKDALKELEDAGLLVRMSGGFSKAKILYVLLPSEGQFPDNVEKQSSIGPENCPYEGRFFGPMRASFPAPIQVIESKNNSKREGVRERTPFGRYKNVFLYPEEYEQLCRDYPGRIDPLLEEMSSYCAASGKTYPNCEAALRRWAAREAGKNNKYEDYSCEKGESF